MLMKIHYANITYSRLISQLNTSSEYVTSNMSQNTHEESLHKERRIYHIIISYIDRFIILRKLSNYLNARFIALNYKYIWGLYHSSHASIAHIKKLQKNITTNKKAVKEVFDYFYARHYFAKNPYITCQHNSQNSLFICKLV